MNYELTQRAHCDLEEVDDYLARRDAKAARDFINRVVEVFELLAEHPEIGRRRPELTEKRVTLSLPAEGSR